MNKQSPIAFALLLPVAAGGAPTGPTEPRQACLSPAEMAALLPASREQAEDFCEDGDARALERVRAVLRLLGRDGPTPGATADDVPPNPMDRGSDGRAAAARRSPKL